MNDLNAILDKILARALMVLREVAIMPRMVNADYSNEAVEQGDTIDVPISTAVPAIAVVPSNVPPVPGNTTTKKVQILLDQWFQNTPIHLTDKQLNEIDRRRHFLPMQLMEAIRGIANQVNLSIHNEYTGVYGYVGTAGTTPFGSDVTPATNARKTLNDQLSPKGMRRGVIDSSAEANALALAPFADAEKTQSTEVKMEGELGRKYGIDWASDDAVVTHTSGTFDANYTVDDAGAALLLGDKAVVVQVGTGTFVVGDIITFAGDTQTYVITAAFAGGAGTIAIEPGLQIVPPDNAVITGKASHVVNLVFHKDAFAYANRPLVSNTIDMALGSQISSMSDPVTGIVLRLEVSRQHKQSVWEFDHLWGKKLVRAELATRIAG